MKTGILKYAFITAIGLTGLLISSYSNVDSLRPASITERDWADSIAAALRSSHIVQIDGEIFIVDTIPCASSADHSFFDRQRQYVYVDCSTCKAAPGKARKGSLGHCTNVRRYEGPR